MAALESRYGLEVHQTVQKQTQLLCPFSFQFSLKTIYCFCCHRIIIQYILLGHHSERKKELSIISLLYLIAYFTKFEGVSVMRFLRYFQYQVYMYGQCHKIDSSWYIAKASITLKPMAHIPPPLSHSFPPTPPLLPSPSPPLHSSFPTPPFSLPSLKVGTINQARAGC